MVVRMIAAMSRRVGASDIDTFGALWDLRRRLDREVVTAIDALLASGIPMAQIATAAGLSRQGLARWRDRPSRASDGNHRLRQAAP